LLENLIRLIRDTSKINNIHQGKWQRKARVYKHTASGGLAAIKKGRQRLFRSTILPLPSDKWRRNAPLLQLTNQKL
jgi:hypothetical protein